MNWIPSHQNEGLSLPILQHERAGLGELAGANFSRFREKKVRGTAGTEMRRSPSAPGAPFRRASPAPAAHLTQVAASRTKGQDNKVQNGSLHQKDTVHDNDFEPYLSGQSNQERQNRNKQ
uniref:YTH N6-methyladenosine RNA binding protein F1 n=1 Tax=Sarcophilus harrisii TaxID=9305 RepID=A0A7N4NNQ7_SARHA